MLKLYHFGSPLVELKNILRRQMGLQNEVKRLSSRILHQMSLDEDTKYHTIESRQ